ncbi:hypothetical protein jhhlp_003391 [Lomentospora prolificans]|uniref:Atos-like conserved domain-containing protein n=1 Tax=Lomentospora prolificans TaxID=41688 RepID=A0A2N3N8T8_9PEZI|nr:hypothetical protein jhhlp_003391 [Lomentospora prolificans]
MPIIQDDFEHDGLVDETRVDRPESITPTKAAKIVEVNPRPVDIQHHHHHYHHRRLSEESIRTELCEGPIPDSPRVVTPELPQPQADKSELIERFRRGESPAWFDRRGGLPHDAPSYPSYTPLLSNSPPPLESIVRKSPPAAVVGGLENDSHPALLPPAQITPERKKDLDSQDNERLQEGLSIERPRSALHSGDFTENEHGQARPQHHVEDRTAGDHRGIVQSPRPLHSWVGTSPPRSYAPFAYGQQTPFSARDEFKSVPSSLSSSFSTSFVYKPPTSPLVQSESNDDLDISLPMNGINIASPSPAPRRHSLYPSASPQPFLFPRSGASTPQSIPSVRREITFPYQAHQPRRSLTSTPSINLPPSFPSTPAYLRSRRPSFGSDTSPLQHASMVGSYEESILRGRMSTTPSKPIEFLAQIGVLGLGKCKANLRCPPHVTLPFPAVYYSYGSNVPGRPGFEDGPSPYVGQLDLENGLANQEDEMRSKRKLHNRYADKKAADDDMEVDDSIPGTGDTETRRTAAPRRRRSGSPKAPPGGSYRIPEKGRIQIVIKNQNKTAVKLFLVPYDLAGMEPGTKTFIRQRSYSAGPIIDGLPQETIAADERPVLRYLVHLHICCPSKGRFYLYKNIRLVFANRVPDGKVKLRNETMWPEPRYSPYKPIRVMHPPVTASSSRSAAMLAAEKAFRRRSAGYYPPYGAPVFNPGEDYHASLTRPRPQVSGSPSPFNFASPSDMPVDPVPFRFPSRNGMDSEASESTDTTGTGMQSPDAARRSDREDGCWKPGRYEKLSKGDVGYGGNAFVAGGPGSPGEEGLLSQKLRSLGVQYQQQQQEPLDQQPREGQ